MDIAYAAAEPASESDIASAPQEPTEKESAEEVLRKQPSSGRYKKCRMKLAAPASETPTA